MKTCPQCGAPMGMSLGRKVRLARERFGITQAQLAEILKISRTSVTNIERGIQNPALDNLVKLAETFNVTTDWLLSCKK